MRRLALTLSLLLGIASPLVHSRHLPTRARARARFSRGADDSMELWKNDTAVEMSLRSRISESDDAAIARLLRARVAEVQLSNTYSSRARTPFARRPRLPAQLGPRCSVIAGLAVVAVFGAVFATAAALPDTSLAVGFSETGAHVSGTPRR